MGINSILIIEDDQSLRSEIVDMLTFEGFQMMEAENGTIGIKLAKEFLPDIILCDIMMPEMDGISVLKELKKYPETMYIPFIFLTALAERTDQRAGMEIGADDYLTKPFTIKELLGAIKARHSKEMLIEDRIKLTFKKVKDSLGNRYKELQKELLESSSSVDLLKQKSKVLEEKLLYQELESNSETLRAIEISKTIKNLVKIVDIELNKKGLGSKEESILIKLKNEIGNPKVLADNRTLFQLKFNQLNPLFLDHLVKQFPKITQQEITLCCGILLNLNTHQISEILNIDPSSVRKNKYRLKKKFMLDKSQHLSVFLFDMKAQLLNKTEM